ncbi:MAG: transketolase [Bacteroidetes bacterium]|nr:transketolase [Bacteroidota bacterium]
MENQFLKKIATTIRGLSMDGVQAANSGHPGLPLGMADVSAVLWSEFLQFNPTNPQWFDRDRFVLSGGHGSMLLYSLLHLYGYDLPLDELKNFRQWGSKTPGHPELHITPGIETTTGPLGQGISTAVGMALAEVSLSARFNQPGHEVVDHFTYVIASDGDLEEGISHEACAFAGHNKLGKLIVLYDDNDITIDGPTSLSFSEDVLKRFDAYGWHTLRVDGHDYDEIRAAIQNAKNTTNKPTIIACKTIIGYGSPNKAGTSNVHGSPLGAEEIKLTKANIGLPEDEDFHVPEEVQDYSKKIAQNGEKVEILWKEKFEAYATEHHELAKQFLADLEGNIPEEAFEIPEFDSNPIATRSASGKTLDFMAPRISSLIGGSADLTPSNNTFPKAETAFSQNNPKGRYIHYGIREHGMGAILNGLAVHGGITPYSGTFFVFSDYMRHSMRLAAMMGLRVIYVMTHDSIGLGEDGPTHQPIEHLSSFRAMPNMSVIRPMGANETAEAWKFALRRKNGPTTLVLTRQKLPVYDRKALGFSSASGAAKGGYVLTEDEGFKGIIIATGSEVEVAVNAKALLNEKGIPVRIVSMPSTDIFDNQSSDYKESVLPSSCKAKVSIEAGSTQSWYKYVGLEGKAIGLDRFGVSGPYKVLFEKLGLTAEAVAEAVGKLVN